MVFPLPRVTTKQPCGPTCNNTRGGKKRGREHHTISSLSRYISYRYSFTFMFISFSMKTQLFILMQSRNLLTILPKHMAGRRYAAQKSNGQYPLLGRNVGNINFDRARTRGCMDEKSYGFHFQQHLSGHVRTATLRPSPSIQINIHESEQDFLSWVNVQ